MNKISETYATANDSANYLQLSLAKLNELSLPPTSENYCVFYVYYSGQNKQLNQRLDNILRDERTIDDAVMQGLFSEYICKCTNIDLEKLNQEILQAMAQILGAIVDFAGQAALSNNALESHLNDMSSESDPKKIIRLAGEIIADTRQFINNTKKIEKAVNETSSQIEKLQEELKLARQEANIDPLTNLLNRRGFELAFKHAMKLSNIDKKKLCILIVDIDHFKSVNDTYGHVIGDNVLKKISRTLSNNVRSDDYVARYGGEEFVLILAKTKISDAHMIAEKIRKTIEKLRLTMQRSGVALKPITVSIGLAEMRENEELTVLLNRCDQALYNAKKQGRNRTNIAD